MTRTDMPLELHEQSAHMGRFVFLICFVAALGGFLFGYDLVVISGAIIYLQKYFALEGWSLGFAASSATLGCIAGPFLGAWLCDAIGRRDTLKVAAVLYAVSTIWTGLARDIWTFNVYQIVGGVGVGLSSMAAPMYISEVAPARLRGRLGLMFQLAVCTGAVASVIVAYFLSRYVREDLSWRWMFGSEIVPNVIFFVLLFFVPRSPRWLAGRGRDDQALSVLARIDGPETAPALLREIKESLVVETGRWTEIFEPGMRKAMVVGILLALFNNWTGWTGIAFYQPILFQKAGFTNPSDAIWQMMLVMGGNVLLTVISIWLVDRVGRRPLWIVTSAAMCLALIATGLVFHFNVQGFFVVLIIFICAAPHMIGLGALPWLMMSEIYPNRIRARAVAISTTFLWVAAFTGPLAFPRLVEISERHLGSVAGVFWLYAVICVFAFIFGIKMLPETKGRTLEEIGSSWVPTESRGFPVIRKPDSKR